MSKPLPVSSYDKGCTRGPMKINIDIFDVMDSMARSCGIKDVEWAQAAGIRRPTIYDLRKMSIIYKEKGENKKMGRVCTIDKLVTLYKGLEKLLPGGVDLARDLRKAIEKETDKKKKLRMYVMLLEELDDDDRTDVAIATMKHLTKKEKK